MVDSQIKHMVDRFLNWKLPENFNPDGGISFEKIRNIHTTYPAKNEPVGTNLLDAAQAEEMVRHMVAEMPKVVTHEVSNKFVVANGKLCKRDTLEPIPEDEPVFVLRARDYFAVKVLYCFHELCKSGGVTDWQIRKNQETIERFEQFKKTHPERMKQPGCTRGL